MKQDGRDKKKRYTKGQRYKKRNIYRERGM